MSPKSKKELYQTGIGGLILSVVLFIICLIAHKVTGYWTLCVGLAVASLLSIAGGCPINFMNSIKPSVKKTIYNISFFIVIASVVANKQHEKINLNCCGCADGYVMRQQRTETDY